MSDDERGGECVLEREDVWMCDLEDDDGWG